MTGLQKGLIAGGVILVVGAVVAASVLVKGKPKGTEVYMATATKKDLSSVVTATGKIEARTKVNVQSSVIGEIVKLPVKEGDLVTAIDHLRQAVDQNPRYSAAWKALGEAHARAGSTSRAAEVYERGIQAAREAGDIQAAKEMDVFLRRLRKPRPGS